MMRVAPAGSPAAYISITASVAAAAAVMLLRAAGGQPPEVGGQQRPPRQEGGQQGRQGPGRNGGRRGGGPQETADSMQTTVPDHTGDVVLCRPTDSSISLSILLKESRRVRVEYAAGEAASGKKSDPLTLQAAAPGMVTLQGLAPDAAYQYRIVDADTGAQILPETGRGRFRTCRKPGSTFTFVMQADSHLDSNSSTSVYRSSLANQAADKPDFLIDLGDTFMTGKHPGRESAAKQYVAQHYYLGQVGQNAPVFFTIGNHDGEELKRPGAADADGLAVWSCLQRKKYFPNPEPGAFYTGNTTQRPFAGTLQNYYSWSWGDALFVVLDPYWTSGNTRRGQDSWAMSLGKPQYDWLAKTLRASRAKYKFLFIHQLVGGTADGGRGGAESASLFEWGGKDYTGADTFAANRPGWEKPIHSLLKETGVTAVFHGHDHFYAHQELDGIVYQLVPQPSAANNRNDHAEEYGYLKGDFLPSSGHLRVTVSAEKAVVQYVVGAAADMRGGPQAKNGSIAAEFTLKPHTLAGAVAN